MPVQKSRIAALAITILASGCAHDDPPGDIGFQREMTVGIDQNQSRKSVPPTRQFTVPSDRLITFVKRFEGFRSIAYDDLDPQRELMVGNIPKGTLTIGWGCTSDVLIGQRITKEDAEGCLRAGLTRVLHDIETLVAVALDPSQRDALASFTFNVGRGALQRSTLLRKLNDGDHAGAAGEFERWVFSGGRKLKGLMTRRAAEKQLFLLSVAEPDSQG